MAEPRFPVATALAYRPSDSFLHRVATGPKLLGAFATSACAIALDSPLLLLSLLAGVCAGYALARLEARDLWRDARWILVQGALIVGLTVALRGLDAWDGGLRAAVRIGLFFLPMALVLRTTESSTILTTLGRWLPARLAFAVSACARLAPFLARELSQLITAQRLRGARLAPRDLWRPVSWRDWLSCVAVPMAVRAIEVADDTATAAEIRGLTREGGTAWTRSG